MRKILLPFPSQDAAILCHGLGDHKDGFCLPAMADTLASAGLASLRLDFPGNGESEGTFRYANMRDEVQGKLHCTFQVPDVLLSK